MCCQEYTPKLCERMRFTLSSFLLNSVCKAMSIKKDKISNWIGKMSNYIKYWSVDVIYKLVFERHLKYELKKKYGDDPTATRAGLL